MENVKEQNVPYKPLLTRMADPQKSPVHKYQDFFIGSRSYAELIRFETITSLLQSFPGALGLFLRAKLYPMLFKRCGKNTVFGRNITLRVTKRIELGNRNLVDDNAVLDAKGNPDRTFISCGDDVEISRNTILSCKENGSITVGNFVSIGRNVLLSARTSIEIGDNSSIGPYACILASGHDWSDPDTPVLLQDRKVEKITIEDNVWIGAHVTILDGVTIGANSVVAANSVVTHDLPAYSIAAGQPARVVSYRKEVRDNGQADKERGRSGALQAQANEELEFVQSESDEAESSEYAVEGSIVGVLYSAIDELNQQRPENMQLEKSPDTVLFMGPADNSGPLDSLGLLNLIVMTEQKLAEELSVTVSLADEAVSSGQNSFRTIGVLADHISTLINEADQG